MELQVGDRLTDEEGEWELFRRTSAHTARPTCRSAERRDVFASGDSAGDPPNADVRPDAHQEINKLQVKRSWSNRRVARR